MCIDGNTLDQLPEDGNLAQLRVIAIDSPTMDPTSTTSTSTSSSPPITSTSPDDVILTCNSSLVDEPYDSYCAHLPQLFVPTAMRSMTEQEAVVKSVEERQSSSSPSSLSATLMCPSIRGMPINDFTTEGYFTCFFPTLFQVLLISQVKEDRIKSPSLINTSQPCISDQCLPVCIIIIHYYTLQGIISTVYSIAPSGPFDVARTIIIQGIYLATTVYLAQHSII